MGNTDWENNFSHSFTFNILMGSRKKTLKDSYHEKITIHKIGFIKIPIAVPVSGDFGLTPVNGKHLIEEQHFCTFSGFLKKKLTYIDIFYKSFFTYVSQ